jgi:negative regulator of sigma E activity
MQITKADIERAREILALRAPLLDQSGELIERVRFAVAQGIAEGREQGIKLTTAANEP